MFGPDPVEFAMKRVRVVVKDGVARFDVELMPPSIFRGRIFDPDGKSLAGAIVTAESVAPNRLPVRTEADEQGRFSVGVHSGRYRLQVRPPSERASIAYYPGVTDPAAAETIAVGEAADLGGYDIRLRPAAERVSAASFAAPRAAPCPAPRSPSMSGTHSAGHGPP